MSQRFGTNCLRASGRYRPRPVKQAEGKTVRYTRHVMEQPPPGWNSEACRGNGRPAIRQLRLRRLSRTYSFLQRKAETLMKCLWCLVCAVDVFIRCSAPRDKAANQPGLAVWRQGGATQRGVYNPQSHSCRHRVLPCAALLLTPHCSNSLLKRCSPYKPALGYLASP